MQPSPYTPGEVAREVPGRATQLAEIDERLSYMVSLQRLVGRIRVDTGPRGLGKTSLLRETQRRAEAAGVSTVWVTAGDGDRARDLIGAVAAQIERRAADWTDQSRHRIRSLVSDLEVTVTAGVPGVAQVEAVRRPRTDPATRTPAGSREFETLLITAVTAAREHGHHGLIVCIDEIQSADTAGLSVLAHTWQHLQAEQPNLPLATFAAGLPDSPEAVAAAATFSERFAYRPLDRLGDDAVRVALAGPARRLGVEWEPAALERAVSAAQGYPYAVQLYGDATWAAAQFPDTGGRLEEHHVQHAAEAVHVDMTALYRVRWDKATPRERDLLAAMASLGDHPVTRRQVADALGITSDQLGPLRAQLIDKGLISSAQYGELVFTVPGFGAYVRERQSRTAAPDDRWRTLAHGIDPNLLNDPAWPVLERLIIAADAQPTYDVEQRLPALARQRDLGSSRPAAELMYRLLADQPNLALEPSTDQPTPLSPAAPPPPLPGSESERRAGRSGPPR